VDAEPKPKKRWWRPRPWWLAVLFWLIALDQLSWGPALYCRRRGWISPAAFRVVATYVAPSIFPESVETALGLGVWLRFWDDLARRHAGLPPRPEL
jgi:hypothetical protein